MRNSLLLMVFVFSGILSFAQVCISSDGSMPHTAAMLEVKSDSKGLLPPRLTTAQMNSIPEPPDGLLVYNSSNNALYWYNGSTWKKFNEFSYTEDDPLFQAHAAYGITTSDIGNWNDAYSRRILGATATSPLSLTLNGNQLYGSIAQAGANSGGYLSSADWNTFNNKVSSQWLNNSTKLYYSSGFVGIGTSNPVPSAALEVRSNSAGFLMPRMMRIQRDAIVSPAEGLLVYCMDCGSNGALCMYINGTWITFSPCSISAPVSALATLVPGSIIWNWQPVPGAAGYKWNTSPNYFTATNLGNVLNKAETGTSCGSSYTRYLWAYNSCGESAMTTLQVTVNPTPPASPSLKETTSSTVNSIHWKWSLVGNASGYKWNSVNNLTTATDIGNVDSFLESGLTCNTVYTRYLWAYNGCGTSSVCVINFATGNCSSFNCGQNLAINHKTDNGVAPVLKTVNYETVADVLGAPAICWLTRNLGATLQATSATNSTEDQSGWYWQFNRKQGYKHTGSVRVPNNAWTTSISENVDWEISNDPCRIELGSNWRLPTSTEWSNIDVAGNWSNLNGPWNSVLKLHAAGYLRNTNGTLTSRGSLGFYWSSTGVNVNPYSAAIPLLFSGSSCGLSNGDNKAYASPVRCLKDGCNPLPPVQVAASSTANTITWQFVPVNGASGYKMSATNNPATATPIGNTTTWTETGLTCGTVYTRFFWAYDTCGAGMGSQMVYGTQNCPGNFQCGQNLVVNHVGGYNQTAPYSLSTAYGTVINVPGEPGKCWITRNLGASRQASYSTDDSEESLGWYWQFSNPYGKALVSGNIAPDDYYWYIDNWANSNWQSVNDPCSLELGSPWRIPMYSEWFNVDNTGNWSDLNSAWNSPLKLHAAGFIRYSYDNIGTPYLEYRNGGYGGYYYSSTQANEYDAWTLQGSNNSLNPYEMVQRDKTFGNSVRCLRD